MWDVFISHASEDKQAIAEPLVHALQQAGLTVRRIHVVHRLARTEFCGAVAGASVPVPAGPRTVSTTGPSSTTPSSASAW
jgi:hypothetical protein